VRAVPTTVLRFLLTTSGGGRAGGGQRDPYLHIRTCPSISVTMSPFLNLMLAYAGAPMSMLSTVQIRLITIDTKRCARMHEQGGGTRRETITRALTHESHVATYSCKHDLQLRSSIPPGGSRNSQFARPHSNLPAYARRIGLQKSVASKVASKKWFASSKLHLISVPTANATLGRKRDAEDRPSSWLRTSRHLPTTRTSARCVQHVQELLSCSCEMGKRAHMRH
jgi:hypothetical protein